MHRTDAIHYNTSTHTLIALHEIFVHIFEHTLLYSENQDTLYTNKESKITLTQLLIENFINSFLFTITPLFFTILNH